jgi:tetratricopeptide (TPR) repeat protein
MFSLRRLITPTLYFLTVVNVPLAQTAPGSTGKPDYSQEALIYLQHSTKVSFDNSGISKREVSAQLKVNSEAGIKQVGVLRFSYESAVASLQINYLRVRKPDGSLVDTPVDNIQDMPSDITREAPFYSDIREKHAAVKGLSPGDVLEYSYTDTLEKPLIPGQFWIEFNFIRQNIALEEDLEVRFPRERSIKYKSLVAPPAMTEDVTTRIFRWTTSNPKVESTDSTDHPRRTALEQIQGRNRQPDVRLSSFQSWDEIGRWYESLQHERVAVTPEIAAKAAALIKNASDENAKLHAIYNYVSLQFRYIGIAFGIGRYQPHSAAEILGNQYGDCKDKHTLVAALLTAAGFHVHPALINTTRDIDPDVPAPSQFNHVISVVERDGQLIWLDTTTEVGPFGYLLPQLLDKKALVMAEGKPAQLLTTPAQLPFKWIEQFKLDGKLDKDGTLEAKVERTERGDGEVILRAALRQLSPAQWKELLQRVSYASGFGGDIDNVVASSLDNIDEPLHITYNYTRKEYGDWENRRIGAPLPILLYAKAPNEKREAVPFWLGNPGEASVESRVQLPDGYSMNPLGNVDLKYDFGEFHASYEVNQGVLLAKRKLVTYKTLVPVDKLSDYEAFRKAVVDDYQEMASLTTASATTASEATPGDPVLRAFRDLPDSDNAEALAFERAGRQKLQTRDAAGAESDFSHAVETDSKFVRGWIDLGLAYFLHTDVDKAVEAFRAAIKADAKQPISYKFLAAFFVHNGENDKAAEVLQDLIKLVPGDSEAHAQLASTLYVLKRYKQAAAEYQSAIQTGKDKSELEAGLGLSYLRAGDHEQGSAAIDKAVALDSTPSSLNNIAYELADANLELTKSQDYAEKAVAAVETESATVNLDKLTTKDLARMSSLAADWDTLGWVYFRAGNLDGAEKYLEAAWNLGQYAIIGDHLGQIYEAQHKARAAIQAYEWALATSPSRMSRNDMPETRKRLAHLRSAATADMSAKAGEDLGKMRTTHLQRIVPGSASADFFVLISEGPKVEDVTFVSGDPKLKSAADVLKKAKLNVIFPDHAQTRLLRRGMVVCSSITGCEFVLLTPDTVKSVN